MDKSNRDRYKQPPESKANKNSSYTQGLLKKHMLVPVRGFKVCCCCNYWWLTSSPGSHGAGLQLPQDSDWNPCVLKIAVVLRVTWSLSHLLYNTLDHHTLSFSAASSKLLCPKPQWPAPPWAQTFSHPAFYPQIPPPERPPTLNLILPTCFLFPLAPHKHFASGMLGPFKVEARASEGKGKL